MDFPILEDLIEIEDCFMSEDEEDIPMHPPVNLTPSSPRPEVRHVRFADKVTVFYDSPLSSVNKPLGLDGDQPEPHLAITGSSSETVTMGHGTDPSDTPADSLSAINVEFSPVSPC